MVRGTRVNLTSPQGFEPAKNFSGFTNETESASVMVTEMPIPFEAATAAYTKEGLETKGMKLVSKDSVQSGDYPGYIIEVRQRAYGAEFTKWINVFGDKSQTILVTATFPSTEQESFKNAMKDAVLSARFDAKAETPSPMDDLPFTVSGTSTLKVAGRVQNSLLLTSSGKMTPTEDDKNRSVFVIGQALSDIDVGDKTEFAKARLQKLDFSDIKMLDEKDVSVAGMPAREITATGKDKTGRECFILQTIAYGRGSYFIMQGITDMESRTRMEFEFRNVINSLKLKTAAT